MDRNDLKMGFWLGLGLIGAFIVVGIAGRVLGKVSQMAGLSLGMNTGYSGSNVKLASVPTAATSAGSGRVTISDKAFGIGTSQTDVGPRTAGLGTVALGIAGAAILAYLWWSLPR